MGSSEQWVGQLRQRLLISDDFRPCIVVRVALHLWFVALMHKNSHTGLELGHSAPVPINLE